VARRAIVGDDRKASQNFEATVPAAFEGGIAP
jgi:hypothetical protein